MRSAVLTILCVILSGAAVKGNDLLNLRGLFVSPGITVSKYGKDPYFGGEVSLFSTRGYYYAGGFAEGGYVTGRNDLRFVIGPEIGILVFGVDCGFMTIKDNDRWMNGFCFRPYLAIPLPGLGVDRGMMFNVFYRRDSWSGKDSWKHENEVGIQLKCAFLAVN